MKTVFSCALTVSTTKDPDQSVGLLRYDDSNVYRFVKNAEASTTINAGAPVAHAYGDGADMLKNVKIPLTANLGLLGGIAMADIAAGSYGWIMVEGQHNTAAVFASQTSVRTLGIHLLGVNAQQYLEYDVADGTAPKYRRTMKLLSTIATVTTGAAASGKVLVNCR